MREEKKMTMLENDFAGEKSNSFQWPEIKRIERDFNIEVSWIRVDESSGKTKVQREKCLECSIFSHNHDRDSCRNHFCFWSELPSTFFAILCKIEKKS